MQSKAGTISEYIDSLPSDRREAIVAVRETILKNLPKGYEENMALWVGKTFFGLTALMKSMASLVFAQGAIAGAAKTSTDILGKVNESPG